MADRYDRNVNRLVAVDGVRVKVECGENEGEAEIQQQRVEPPEKMERKGDILKLSAE